MSDQANEKILWQVMDIIGANISLTNYEAMTFSLQLLGWAKVSQAGGLKAAYKIQATNYTNPNWIENAWAELAKQSDILKLAYANWKMPARLTPSTICAAIDLCVRLAETGMLDKFDPSDCVSQITGREAGQYSLPPELADVMICLARIKSGSSVYTPWDNSIQLAARAAKMGAKTYIETMREATLPALVSMFIGGKIDIVHGDPICEPSAVEGGKLRQFDNCLAFPPIGVRYSPDIADRDLYGRFKEKTNSGTVLAVRHIMAHTRGRAVIAIPHSFLFSPGADRNIREELLKRGLLESVIAMPSGLFAHTNISFALLVLNMSKPVKKIRFVNAEDDRFREPISKARAKLKDMEGIAARANAALTDDLVVEATTKEIFDNDATMQVNRYVVPKSILKTERLLASSQTQQLGDIVKILRPMPTTANRSAVKAWEVGAADLPEFAYIAQPAKEVGIDPATAQRNNHQFLQPLDIVLIIKGSVGKVGIVPNDIPLPGEGGWVVGQSAVILRVTRLDLIDPKTLIVYLRSPLGRELLERISVKGATIPLIQQRELQRLQIVIPTKKEAAFIGNIVDEQSKIQQEIEKLRTRQVELTGKVWSLD